MADPFSITASALTVATAAIVSIRSLCDTIKSFKARDNNLRRLQNNLHDLATVLDSLVQVIDADTSILELLEGPIDRCKEVCTEFEKLIKKFHGKSKTGLLDWTKLEFMKGDIHDFIENIEGYKSTIQVGLGTINLRDSKVSRSVLQQYEEMIKDTAYNLEMHLQKIDEKLTRSEDQDTNTPATTVDLQDERAVTEQCLRVCKDASSYIELLATRESTILQDGSKVNSGENMEEFEAQMLMRQAFNTSQATFLGVINRLGERLQSTLRNDGTRNENERLTLQEDIDMSKQLLQVCKMASEISHQKIHRIGEVVAEDNSDQVVVTTLADLFDVKRALSKGHSAQLVATLTPENFDNVVEKRYNSRFAAVPDRSTQSQVNGSTVSPVDSSSQDSKQSVPRGTGGDAPLSRSDAKRDKPNPNEMRKRSGE